MDETLELELEGEPEVLVGMLDVDGDASTLEVVEAPEDVLEAAGDTLELVAAVEELAFDAIEVLEAEFDVLVEDTLAGVVEAPLLEEDEAPED